MGGLLAALAGLLISTAVALLAPRLPRPWRIGRSAALWCGLSAGLAVCWATGAATSLVVILLGAGLLAGLAEAVLRRLEVRWPLRLLAQVIVLGATMALEYRRGDLFAATAAVGLVVGVVGFNVIVFATGAAARTGARRSPVVLTLLGAAYVGIIAHGLPNPGLTTLVALVAAAAVPLLVLPVRGGSANALGAGLGTAGLATGWYAWLANASPAMVLAPLAVVGLDVGWTLVARVVTAPGRARLAAAGSWWRAIDAWATPADDLVAQRLARATSPLLASAWVVAGTVGMLVLSLTQWQLGIRWLAAGATLALLALAWLLVALAVATARPRADLVAWLAGVGVIAVVLAAAARLSDGRPVATALPPLAALLAWAATPVLLATARRRGGSGRNRRRPPGGGWRR